MRSDGIEGAVVGAQRAVPVVYYKFSYRLNVQSKQTRYAPLPEVGEGQGVG